MYRNGDDELRVTRDEYFHIKEVLFDLVLQVFPLWPCTYVELRGDKKDLDVIVQLLLESDFEFAVPKLPA
jgi:hypothetical protein